MDTNDEAKVAEIAKEVVDDKVEQLRDAINLGNIAQVKRLSLGEICNTARHYSNLRFAMFTVFTTIMGALIGLELRQYGSLPPALAPPRWLVMYFRFASLVLVFLFSLGQWRVSELIVQYQKKADSLSEGVPLPTRHELWSAITPVIMLAPFLLALVFWAWTIKKMVY